MKKISKIIVSKYELIFLYNDIYKILLRENIEINKDENGLCFYDEYVLIREIPSNFEADKYVEKNFKTLLNIAKMNDEEIKKENQITSYQKNLSNSDYKILKSLENYSLGLPLPYDYSILLSERQELRDEINNLQSSSEIENNELEQAKSRKIVEMCSVCQTTITNGIDYNDEHYRLNTSDQINLTSLYALAQMGQDVPYHADGKVCRIYKAEEMIKLSQTATKWIIYHTTYYNLLKNQINEMTDIESVKEVYYGMTLKEDYQAIINVITGG